MKKFRWSLLLSGTLLAGCGSQSEKPQIGGKEIYLSLNCRTCHQIGPQGGTGGPDLTLVGFRRSEEWLDVWLKDPQAWQKGALMPKPNLSPTTRGKLVEYLASLKGQDFSQGTPWSKSDPHKMGQMIYTRAGCITCHGKGGVGGYPNNNVAGGQIPSLLKVASSYTKEELKEKIRRGVKPEKKDPNGPEPLISMPAWGQFLKEHELDAVAEYLLTLSAGSSKASDF